MFSLLSLYIFPTLLICPPPSLPIPFSAILAFFHSIWPLFTTATGTKHWAKKGISIDERGGEGKGAEKLPHRKRRWVPGASSARPPPPHHFLFPLCVFPLSHYPILFSSSLNTLPVLFHPLHSHWQNRHRGRRSVCVCVPKGPTANGPIKGLKAGREK